MEKLMHRMVKEGIFIHSPHAHPFKCWSGRHCASCFTLWCDSSVSLHWTHFTIEKAEGLKAQQVTQSHTTRHADFRPQSLGPDSKTLVLSSPSLNPQLHVFLWSPLALTDSPLSSRTHLPCSPTPIRTPSPAGSFSALPTSFSSPRLVQNYSDALNGSFSPSPDGLSL